MIDNNIHQTNMGCVAVSCENKTVCAKGAGHKSCSIAYAKVNNFFSLGLQYQGLFDGRDDDVFGVGYGRGFFSNTATDYTKDYESVCEAYYNAQITPWFVFGPSIQYVANPGGSNTAKDALVFGVRAQVTF